MPMVSAGLPEYDPQHAPEHLVLNLSANIPMRRARYPGDEDTRERHIAFAREIADRIWREAYTAGAVHGMKLRRHGYEWVGGVDLAEVSVPRLAPDSPPAA